MIRSSYIRFVLQYLVTFFVVMVLYDLGFGETIEWIRNMISALVFALLMAYFKTR
jgi:hypothetical protein